jgi:hypothetical protein
MEFALFVVEILAAYSFSFFPGAKTFKIFSCFRDIIIQLNNYLPLINIIDRDIKIDAIGLLIIQLPLFLYLLTFNKGHVRDILSARYKPHYYFDGFGSILMGQHI